VHGIPSIEQVERALCGRPGGLYQFFRLAWPVFKEMQLVDGWHLEEVCAHLEAISRGELDRLVINIPPGFSKSTLVSVCWQAWEWGANLHPERRYMTASFDMDLSRRDSMDCKGLIQSDWYQRRWGTLANRQELTDLGLAKPVYVVAGNEAKQDTASIWHSSGGGLRFATSVEGKATGWHSHIQLVDDPTNPNTIKQGGKQAIKQLESDWKWWTGTMPTRKADPKFFARVVIMQRLHDLDIAGQCTKEGWTTLCLPISFSAKRRCLTPWGGDRRTVEGELLHPGRFDEKAVAVTRKELGPIQAAAQLDQNPAPESGAIYDRGWFNHRITQVPNGLQFLQSWDFTFKDTTDSDYVVGVQWAYGGGKYYLLDIVRDKVGFLAATQMLRDFAQKWHHFNHRIVIEDKANGPAIMDTLTNNPNPEKNIPGIIPYSPVDSKEARAKAVSGYWEAGDVVIWEHCPHLSDLVTEHTRFPRGENDDIVDACNQGLLFMLGKNQAFNKVARAMADAGASGYRA
jgi:predicted phage terminase large subunit-like protein